MLIRSLKMSFWVLYDHLGKLVLVNLTSAFLVLVPIMYVVKIFDQGSLRQYLFIAVPMVLTTLVLMVPLLHVGLISMIKEIIEKHDGSVLTFFMGIRIYGLRAIGTSIFYAFCVLIVASSVWFYSGAIAQFSPLVAFSLRALALWFFAFILAAATLTLPALVNKNSSVVDSIRTASVLVIDNPILMLGIMAHLALVLVFSIAPPVFALFSFAPIAVMQASTYEILSRKYYAIQAYQEKTGKTDKRITIDFGDENDEYLCRGLRDLLFPWKE